MQRPMWECLRGTKREWRDCCFYVFVELWLHGNTLDASLQLDGTTLFRTVKKAAISGKTRGEGLCIYINNDWCVNTTIVTNHCSPLAEFLVDKCHPFYLPREFTKVIVVAVYVAPGANISAKADAPEALGELRLWIFKTR